MDTGENVLNLTPMAYAITSRIYMWDFIKLKSFCKMIILTVLRLPMHEHGRSFYLLKYSISFFRDLKFFSYRFFTSLVKATPRYFISFLTIAKGVTLISSYSC